MNNTMTSDWKSKQSPRTKGRVQIALQTDKGMDSNDEDMGLKRKGIPKGDLLTKKEMSMTGNFPAQRNFALQSGSDQNRMTVYNNGGVKSNQGGRNPNYGGK